MMHMGVLVVITVMAMVEVMKNTMCSADGVILETNPRCKLTETCLVYRGSM